jgi:hypothetical protein
VIAFVIRGCDRVREDADQKFSAGSTAGPFHSAQAKTLVDQRQPALHFRACKPEQADDFEPLLAGFTGIERRTVGKAFQRDNITGRSEKRRSSCSFVTPVSPWMHAVTARSALRREPALALIRRGLRS